MLSQMEENLLSDLHAFGISPRGRALIAARVFAKDKVEEMVDYMANHLEATEEDLLRKAYEIAG